MPEPRPPAKPLVPRGTILPWMSLVRPPEGYRFAPLSRVYAIHAPVPIIATRNHDSYPRIPEDLLMQIEMVNDRQMKYAAPWEGSA